MITLKRQGNTSATVLSIGGGIEVLFSYETPVAVSYPQGVMWRSKEYMPGGGTSVTTERQINQWIRGFTQTPSEVKEVKQSRIESVLDPENIAKAVWIAESLNIKGFRMGEGS